MFTKSHLNKILKNKSIVDYLSKRGFEPIRRSDSGRCCYLCPLPDHKDSKPSFFVWTDSEPQRFKCFGCGVGGTLIRLMSVMEGINYKEALNCLGAGVDTGLDADVKLIIDEIEQKCNEELNEISLDHMLISISRTCRLYLEGVAYEPEEVIIVDGFFAALDKELALGDMEGISETYNNLLPVLDLRRDKFEKRMNQPEIAIFHDIEQD